MRSALFWAVTRRTLVVSYHRSGQANYQLQLLYIPKGEDPTDIAAELRNHAVIRTSKFRFIARTVLLIMSSFALHSLKKVELLIGYYWCAHF